MVRGVLKRRKGQPLRRPPFFRRQTDRAPLALAQRIDHDFAVDPARVEEPDQIIGAGHRARRRATE